MNNKSVLVIQRWTLMVMVFSVPVLFWTGTILNIDVKYLLVRAGTILLAVSFLFETIENRRIEYPSLLIPASAALFCLFTLGVGLYNSYTDWSVFADIAIALAFFLCVLSLTRDAEYARKILAAWVSSSVLVCTYYLVHIAGFDPIAWFNPNHNAFGSTFGNRNYMAYFLAGTLPFALFLSIDTKKASRLFFMSAAVLIAGTLILCNSRSSMGILAITFPAYLWYFGRHDSRFSVNKPVRFLFIASIAGLSTSLVAACYHAARLSIKDLDMLSHGRLGIWKDTLKLIADNPWFGHGPGSFQRIFPEFRSTELGYMFGFLEPVFNSHNVGLEIISESGLIGFVIFMAVVVFGTGIHAFRREIFNKNRDMAFFSGLSLLGCGLFSITGEISNILFCTMFSWLALALFHNSISGRFHIKRFESKPMPYMLLMPAAALFFASLVFFGTRFVANIQVRSATNVIHAEPYKAMAKEHLNRALIWEPRNPFALYQLAYLEMREGRPRQALEYYHLIRTIDPYFENLQFNMGIAWYSLGNYRSAIESLSETARLYPTFERASYFISKSYLSLRHYDSAKVWHSHLVKYSSDKKLAETLEELILTGQSESGKQLAPTLN